MEEEGGGLEEEVEEEEEIGGGLEEAWGVCVEEGGWEEDLELLVEELELCGLSGSGGSELRLSGLLPPSLLE